MTSKDSTHTFRVRITPGDRFNGHSVYYDGCWRFCSDGVPVQEDRFRPCPTCGRRPTPEKHDACLGSLPGVRFACCGHGDPSRACVTLDDEEGTVLSAFEAVEYFESCGRAVPWLVPLVWEQRDEVSS